jgi:hypothetical protein
MAKKGERKEKKISNWEKIVESKISFLLIGIVIGMFIVLVVSLLYMTTLSIIKETTHTIIQYQTVYRPTTEYLKKSITYTKIITTTVTMPITIVQTALKTETLPGTTIQTLTPYEKLEITSAYTEWDYINNAWKITLIGKNNGLIDITIAEITLNGKTINVNSNEKTIFYIDGYLKEWSSLPKEWIIIPFNKNFTINILQKSGTTTPLTSGQTIEVTLITSSGKLYSKLLVLP